MAHRPGRSSSRCTVILPQLVGSTAVGGELACGVPLLGAHQVERGTLALSTAAGQVSDVLQVGCDLLEDAGVEAVDTVAQDVKGIQGRGTS